MAIPLTELMRPAAMDRQCLRFHQRDPHYSDVLIDPAELRRRIRLDSPSTWTEPKADIDLGNMSDLPVETVMNIFQMTSISDLFRLRATNSHLKNLIEQWDPFKTITTHGSDAIRALLATGAGRSWTVGQLLDVLFSTNCELCGEHGEILYLLKLKRCCFRCLSEERELLAVSTSYAEKFMGLRREEFSILPQVKTISQKDFWGFQSREDVVVDYQNALKIAGDRVADDCTKYKAKEFHTFRASKTGLFLEEKFRSAQPRPRASLQQRRGERSLLRIPSAVIAAPETEYRQHACAIRLPAMTRKKTRLRDGSFKYSVTVVGAFHCEGCAYFWNYHSPLPYRSHKMYTHDLSGGPTDFTRHLQYCIYAHCHWTRISSPWHPVSLQDRIFALEKWRLWFWPRHPTRSVEKSNSKFECVPPRMEILLQEFEVDYGTFQEPYRWPTMSGASPETNEQRLMRQRIVERDAQAAQSEILTGNVDQYWDMLVSQDAVSQSNWACASLSNGTSALFRGPLALLWTRRVRCNRKLWCGYTADQKQPAWGFEWF